MKLIKKYFLVAVMALTVVLICGCDIKPSTSTTKLATPTNLNYANDYVLEWDEVENATGYTVLIGSNSIKVTETKIDLNEYLNEGKNNVWVTATSTNSRYSSSDAAGISVDYSTFKSTYLTGLLQDEYTKAFEYKKSQFKSDLEYTAYCINFATENAEAYATICDGVAVTPAQVVALDKITIFMNQMIDEEATPTVESVFEIIDAIRDSKISHRSLAQITYNTIELYMNSIVYELDTDIDTNTVLSLVLANESLTVDTLEVVYEYLDKALADTEKVLNDQTVTNQVAEIIKAFLGTNRPTVDKFGTLTTYVKTAINAFVKNSTDGNRAIQVLPDAFNLLLAVIDPTLDMVNKAATVLSSENYAAIATNISTIVENGMAIYNSIVVGDSSSTEELVTNIQGIMTAIDSIATTISTSVKDVDFSKELTAIETAVETFVSTESVKTFAKEVAVSLIETLTGKTTDEAEKILTKILEIISSIDSEKGFTEETIESILAALGMTEDELTEKVVDLIATGVTDSIETPEMAEELIKKVSSIQNDIESLKDQAGDISLSGIIGLLGDDVLEIVEGVFPGVFDSYYIDGKFVDAILATINEKANEILESMSDNILDQYLGVWYVSSEEPDPEDALFYSVVIKKYGIYLDETRAENVTYSENDYYGYTVYVGEDEYYVSLSGERLIIGSSTLLKDTEYTKQETTPITPVVPTIPWDTYNGTYTGKTSDGTSFTVVVSDETITVNDTIFVVTEYDDYSGFTGTINEDVWYVFPGYVAGQIIIAKSDNSVYVTLTNETGSTVTPSLDLSLLAEHTGTYTGKVGEEDFTVVITEESITINGEVVTIVAFEDNTYMVKTVEDTIWCVGLSYGDEKIVVATESFSPFGFLNIVK